MTTTTTTKADVRLLVDVYQPSGTSNYLTVKVSAVYVSDGHIRNPQFSVYDPDKVAHLANLTIDAQASQDSEYFYYSSWNAAHFGEVYTVDLSRAESMVKTLKKIHKFLEKAEGIDGYPVDFAQFVTRVALALGIKEGNFIACKVAGRGPTYDENIYTWMNEYEFRDYLRTRLEQWKGAA